MQNFADIEQVINRAKPYLQKKYMVQRIGVFGSFARGENSKKSDVDFLVEFTQAPDFFLLAALQNYLSRKLGRKVDIVTRHALKPRLANEILREVRYV